MVAPTCFGITLPSSGSFPSAFWEMLNWGAVDKNTVDGRVAHHVTRLNLLGFKAFLNIILNELQHVNMICKNALFNENQPEVLK
jgi:hypothetical protein